MFVRVAVVILLVQSLAACGLAASKQDPKKVFDDPAVYGVSAEIIELFRQGNVDAIVDRIHPKGPPRKKVRATLNKLFQTILSPENEYEITLYYSELRHGKGENASIPIYLTAYDVVGKNEFRQLLLAIAPHEEKCCFITYFRVVEFDVRPSAKFDFTFENRTWRHYLFFGLLIAVPIFILVTAVACAMNKNVKRRWLWVIFILFGLWGAQLNWTTGEIHSLFFEVTSGKIQVNFLQLHLLGAGITKAGPFEPWIISIGLPLGALLYWFWPARRARRDP